MAISYRCPQCQFSHSAPETLAGQTVVCSFCESPIVVPGGEAVVTDPFSPPTPGKTVVAAPASEAIADMRRSSVEPADDPFAPPIAAAADSARPLSAEFQPASDPSLFPPMAKPVEAQVAPAAFASPAPVAAIPAAAHVAEMAEAVPVALAGPMPIDAALVEAKSAPIVAACAAPVGMTDAQWRAELETLVRTRVPLTERIHNRFARIPERKLNAAISTYAQGASASESLVLVDNTMQGTGRNGFVLTVRDLHYFGGQHGDRGRAAVRDIRDARAPDQATILISLFSGGLARILASCVKGSVPFLVEFFNQVGRLNAAAGAGQESAGGSFFGTAGLARVEDDVVDEDVVEDVEIVEDAGTWPAASGIEALLRELFPHDEKACCYRRDRGIPHKALAGAAAAYALGVQPADVLALFDNTGVLSGECGVLFTPQRMYYHSETARKAGQLAYGQIQAAEDDSRGDSRVITLRTTSGAYVPIEYEVARNHGPALLELFRRISAMMTA